MTFALLLAGWLSSQLLHVLAPIDPARPSNAAAFAELPVDPKIGSKFDASRPAKAAAYEEFPVDPKADPKAEPESGEYHGAKIKWKPGRYKPSALVAPASVAMEKFDEWGGGPNWPVIDGSVVVVTPNAVDPVRFMAYLIDVKGQRIAAVRDGDARKHLVMIGQTQTIGGKPGGQDPHQELPPSILELAGSGAVIIITPPKPPGPPGIPPDLAARLIDAATLAAEAGVWVGGMSGLQKGPRG